MKNEAYDATIDWTKLHFGFRFLIDPWAGVRGSSSSLLIIRGSSTSPSALIWIYRGGAREGSVARCRLL